MAYAVIRTGGKQYKAAVGDILEIEKLEAAEGTDVTFEDVLLYTDGETTRTGAEAKGVKVTAELVNQFRGPKVIAFKFRRRKGYHRKRGHRQSLSRVVVKSIAA